MPPSGVGGDTWTSTWRAGIQTSSFCPAFFPRQKKLIGSVILRQAENDLGWELSKVDQQDFTIQTLSKVRVSRPQLSFSETTEMRCSARSVFMTDASNKRQTHQSPSVSRRLFAGLPFPQRSPPCPPSRLITDEPARMLRIR